MLRALSIFMLDNVICSGKLLISYKKQLILLTLCIVDPFYTTAQNEQSSSTLLGLKTHYGFIIPHSRELATIADSYPWGLQLDWSKLSLTQKAWNQCNCYSKVGLSFTYFNFGNPAVLGNAYNLILYGEPYLTFQKDLFFTFSTGIGATYLDQVYDEVTNPQNTFFSSPISFIVFLNFAINYKISPELYLNLTIHYNHISNGGIKQPNKGMNFPTIGLGLDYKTNPLPFKKWDKVEVRKGAIQGYGRLFATRKTATATDEFTEEKRWLLGIAGGAKIMIANFNALSTGVEFFRDNSLSVEARRREIDEDPHVLGWSVGHHFIFGKFNFNQQMIYYVYKPSLLISQKFYQRYELAYQLNEFLVAGISLKAHAQVADNFDLRLGVIF